MQFAPKLTSNKQRRQLKLKLVKKKQNEAVKKNIDKDEPVKKPSQWAFITHDVLCKIIYRIQQIKDIESLKNVRLVNRNWNQAVGLNITALSPFKVKAYRSKRLSKVIKESFPLLKKLNLITTYNGEPVNNRTLIFHLNGLKNLKALVIQTPYNIDKAMETISEIKELEYLDLSGTYQLSDKGLEFIKDLPKLHTLYLTFCPLITSEGLSYLIQLKNLKNLNIDGLINCYDERGIECLTEMKNLKNVTLGYGYYKYNMKEFQISGLSKLTTLENLRSVTIKHGTVNDSDYKSLSDMPSLKILNVPQYNRQQQQQRQQNSNSVR